jgi:hypothetical protein
VTGARAAAAADGWVGAAFSIAKLIAAAMASVNRRRSAGDMPSTSATTAGG